MNSPLYREHDRACVADPGRVRVLELENPSRFCKWPSVPLGFSHLIPRIIELRFIRMPGFHGIQSQILRAFNVYQTFLDSYVSLRYHGRLLHTRCLFLKTAISHGMTSCTKTIADIFVAFFYFNIYFAVAFIDSVLRQKYPLHTKHDERLAPGAGLQKAWNKAKDIINASRAGELP